MTDLPAGTRARKKLATSEALRRAAAELFAKQGYEATTVAQIAAAARVGTRTFYRYFDSKEDLLAEQVLTWMRELHSRIRARPVDEGPYTAMSRAMIESAGQMTADAGSAGAWIQAAPRQPIALLRRATPRPLRRLERTIADAVLPRLQAAADDCTATAERQAQLLGAVAVAALRSAVIAQREQQREDVPDRGLAALLADAFEQLRALSQT